MSIVNRRAARVRQCFERAMQARNDAKHTTRQATDTATRRLTSVPGLAVLFATGGAFGALTGRGGATERPEQDGAGSEPSQRSKLRHHLLATLVTQAASSLMSRSLRGRQDKP